MATRFLFHFLPLLSVFGTVVSAADASDVTLPAVNVKFDFAAKDVAGGAKSTPRAELRGFKHRASNLLESLTADDDSLSQFVSIAGQELDDLQKILSSSAAASLERAQKKRKAEPTLNLHVAEPIDSIEGQKYGRQARATRSELLVLEEREARQREFLTSSVAALTSSLSKLADMVEVMKSK